MSAPDIGIGIGTGTGNVTPVAPEHPVDYRRVYVWELPVRVYHSINAVALVGLCITGYLIGRPIMAFYAPEAYHQYWFGWVRFRISPARSCTCSISRHEFTGDS